VLATAKIMHETGGVAAGVRRRRTRSSILDVGGANGALGKLVIDLAPPENGLEVEYSVVDPFTEGVGCRPPGLRRR